MMSTVYLRNPASLLASATASATPSPVAPLKDLVLAPSPMAGYVMTGILIAVLLGLCVGKIYHDTCANHRQAG